MRLPLLATVMVLGLSGPARVVAQTPQRLLDINQTGDPAAGTDPSDLRAHLGALFYVGDDGANGRDLRKMDAAGAVTFLLDSRDSAGPTEATPAGAFLFFVADDSLHRTDGTPAGTTRVKSFPTDILHSLTYANGLVFFTRFVSGPEELWRSDGSEAGTITLAAANPARLTAAGNRLFFLRTTPAAGRELWTSDGTVTGTHMVSDVCPGPCDGVPTDDAIAAVGPTVFFRGDDGVHGPELWRSDGTPAGTAMVQDSVPGAMGLGPSGLSGFGARVLFASSDGPGLWISDGTSAGTRVLRQDLSADTPIHDAGTLAFFGANDLSGNGSTFGLWTTDGTPAGTRLVSPVCAGGCSYILSFGTLAGITVFTPYDEGGLWRTDGTAAGTFRISPVGAKLGASMERFGSAVYYPGLDQLNGSEIWRTDGTAAGTVLATNRADASSSPVPLASTGDRMFFTAWRPDIGRELWSTTGAGGSTSFLDLVPGPTSSFFPSAIALGGHLVFGHHSESSSLWKTDGTPAGTAVLKPDLGTFSSFALADDIAVMAGGLNGGDIEPWRTNGTTEGTFQAADLKPGIGSSQPAFLASFRGRAHFVAANLDYTVWSTDGTPEGTHLVTSRPCFDLTPVGDKLFMTCSDVVTGHDVWVTDGTEAGTRLVRDISTGHVDELVGVEGYLYFVDDARNVWRSDGTTAGTQKIEDLVGFPVGTLASDPTPSDGVLFYVGFAPATGYELWRTDGTPAGTFLLRDIWPGSDSGVSTSRGLAAAGGGVVFAGYTPATGQEPWRSDGTTAGTTPMQEIVPGPASSRPLHFTNHGGRVFFSADDNITGFEPWTVDLAAAAVAVGDATIHEGDTSMSSAVFQIRLESASASPLTVEYATVAGTAQAGTDFTPVSGTLTFAPGATSTSVEVPVLGDLQDEADETFTLELSGTVTFADRRGLALVLDDDAPAATIANASVTEGNAGNTVAPFLVTLTTRDGSPTPDIKTVGFATSPGTATPGVDYVTSTGTLTFAAGTLSGAAVDLPFSVVGDTFDEPDETFRVALTPTSDLTVPVTPATGLIRDDDGVAAAAPIELSHGSVVRATLDPPPGRASDRDWYVLRQQPRSSYEVAVDETSGDAVPLQVERMGSDGSTVLQAATATGTGASVSLRWENAGSLAVTTEPIRIGSAACGTTCGADDGYRLRLFETTLTAPRVNNTGSQVTVAILQNTTDLVISGRVQFWTVWGGPSTAAPFQLAARQVLVLNTSAIFTGSSGSLTVTHDGPYGSLVGKTVALEPSTGFSFDTPMSYRPR